MIRSGGVARWQSGRLALATLPIPAVLWVVIFGLRPGNFWVLMGTATLGLLAVALVFGRPLPRQPFSLRAFALGAASALPLYLLFVLGRHASNYLHFGASGIQAIYALKGQADPLIVAALLVFPISVGEELYWRGFLQHMLASRWGAAVAYLAATAAYAGVHVAALNPMLFVAALVAGLWWGFLFLRWADLTPVIVSHITWTLMIFLIAPVA